MIYAANVEPNLDLIRNREWALAQQALAAMHDAVALKGTRH